MPDVPRFIRDRRRGEHLVTFTWNTCWNAIISHIDVFWTGLASSIYSQALTSAPSHHIQWASLGIASVFYFMWHCKIISHCAIRFQHSSSVHEYVSGESHQSPSPQLHNNKLAGNRGWFARLSVAPQVKNSSLIRRWLNVVLIHTCIYVQLVLAYSLCWCST